MANEASEGPLSLSPEQEALDTTVDPSYIIQLIRQLLPSAYTKESVKQPCRTNVDDIDASVQESRDTKEKISEQHVDKSSCSTDARVVMDRCRTDSECAQADVGENQNLIDEPSKRVSREIEKSQLPSNESKAHSGGQSGEALAPDEEDETPLGCSGVSDEQREEAGCMLWDLAATQSHAEFM